MTGDVGSTGSTGATGSTGSTGSTGVTGDVALLGVPVQQDLPAQRVARVQQGPLGQLVARV